METDSLRSRIGIVVGSLLLGVVAGYLLGRDDEDDPSPAELDTPELVAELQAKHVVLGGLLDELAERMPEPGEEIQDELQEEIAAFEEEMGFTEEDDPLDIDIMDDITGDEDGTTDIDVELDEDDIDLDDDEIGI